MRLLTFLLCNIIVSCGYAQQLYQMPDSAQSSVSSFENLNGIKGNGGISNHGAKGHAFESIPAGETRTLLDINGQGIIQRIWLTIDQSPMKLRTIHLQMFWDASAKAAVDVPLGDFFVFNLGHPVAFQSALFSSGEGRSFNCYIPMPFRKAAKIILINEGTEPVKLFFDVDFVKLPVPVSSLYFHAYWTRQVTSPLGKDFEPLPKVTGKGRFLGMSVGLQTDPHFGNSWWGEGEIKMYTDGDTTYPTIAGTGLEDYVGSAWGLGTFTNTYQGCTVADAVHGKYDFYRFHIPDAIYFNKDIRVTIQQIGGWLKDSVKNLVKRGVRLQPVTVDAKTGFVRLLDMQNAPAIIDKNFPDGWVNFYRTDNYSSVAYFYLDTPSSNLQSLLPLKVRLENMGK